MEWEDSPHGRIKHLARPEMNSHVKDVDAYMQELPAGGRSGKHRHMAEEFMFVLEGSGYSLHWDVEAVIDATGYTWKVDEEPKRFDWEAGDWVYIPVNTVHQDCNASSEHAARFICAQSRVYKMLGFGDLEQVEAVESDPPHEPHESSKKKGAPVSDAAYLEKTAAVEQLLANTDKVRSAVERYYEDGRVFVREIESGGYSLREEMARQRNGNRVFKASESSWHGGPQKWNRDLVNPASGLLQTLQSSFELLGPGGKSQNHGHQNTALLYVVEGRGYDTSDGVRIDWEEGDVGIVPGGTVHQHFNADPEHPAKILIIKGKPLYMFAHLMFQGFVEKAPNTPVPGFEGWTDRLTRGAPRIGQTRRRSPRPTG